jgi:hypothetical protein
MTTDTLIAGADTTEAGGQQPTEGAKPDGEGTKPDAKTETPDAGGKDEAKGEGDKKDDAVEPIAFEFKLPEGVELDQAGADEFKAIVSDAKLTKSEMAQKLADLVVNREQARLESHTRLVTEWADAVKADKEIGGDKLAENLAVASKAVALGGPELKELLNSSGLGNHPAVVRWALAIGKALSEDRLVPASQVAREKGDIADRLYGSPKN